MRFYNREDELKLLQKADSLKSQRSIMTMVVGMRRVGKTSLVLESFSKREVVYLFVSKKSEVLLCEEFISEIEEKLKVKLFGKITKFEELFEYLLDLAKQREFTLIIDEFQEFLNINPSIYSSMQKLWDLNKDDSHLHLIVCGSVFSLMKKIFENKKEPLFGRLDFKIDLKPFKVFVLKEILEDFGAYSASNLFDMFLITGGVAKYIELFTLYKSFDIDTMCEVMIEPNSLFLDEGKNRLIEEFGKEYGTYFSILSLIASSKTSKSEIESILEKNVSGHLARLENDYNIIKSYKPIDAKPNSKVQKYEIVDNFLAFWFRFIFKYQSLIEAENFDRLKMIIKRDIDTFKGRFLEKLFKQILKERKCYTKIGSYWERGNKNEIDIVAIDELEKKLLIAEVKLNPKRLNYNELVLKSHKLIKKYSDYEVVYKLWSLKDLDKEIKISRRK